MSETALEQVTQLAMRLSRPERARLAKRLEATLDDPLKRRPNASSRSLYGLCADLGPGPTDAEIEAMRGEAWAGFPREDIA